MKQIDFRFVLLNYLGLMVGRKILLYHNTHVKNRLVGWGKAHVQVNNIRLKCEPGISKDKVQTSNIDGSKEKPLLWHNAAVIDMIATATLSLEQSQRDGAQTQDKSGRAEKKQI